MLCYQDIDDHADRGIPTLSPTHGFYANKWLSCICITDVLSPQGRKLRVWVGQEHSGREKRVGQMGCDERGALFGNPIH